MIAKFKSFILFPTSISSFFFVIESSIQFGCEVGPTFYFILRLLNATWLSEMNTHGAKAILSLTSSVTSVRSVRSFYFLQVSVTSPMSKVSYKVTTSEM